jgi:hypothetical protein
MRARFARFLGQARSGPYEIGSHKGAPLFHFKSNHFATTSQWIRPLFSSNYLQYVTQIAIFDVITPLYERGWEAYVVGGTLRDLMTDVPRNGQQSFIPRDIDLVVLAPSIEALESCFPNNLIQRRTRFGGLHLVKKLASGYEVHFDAWPLSETWAFRHCGIEAAMPNFPLTPFLNLDAIAVQLFTKDSAATIYERGFFEGLTSRLVDINFEPNPYPDICAVRALIIAARLHFDLSRKLARFISARASLPAFAERWREAQLSHYGHVRCDRFEINQWMKSISSQVHSGAERVHLPVSEARQLELWEDHPPGSKEKFEKGATSSESDQKHFASWF